MKPKSARRDTSKQPLGKCEKKLSFKKKDLPKKYYTLCTIKERMEHKGVMQGIVLVAIIAISLLAVLPMTISQTVSAGTVSVEPSYIEVTPGEEFTVNVTVNPEGVEIYGAQYELHFNNSLLNATAQDKGPFFGSGSDSTVLKNEINNTMGWLKYGEVRTATPGITEPGVLATVTFHAIDDIDGHSELKFTVVKLSDPNVNPIPANINNGTVEIIQPSSPFLVSGYVFYENGSECNNPRVNITNLNTSEEWQAETSPTSNYYQLVLRHGIDIVTGETLQLDVRSPDGSQSKIVEFKISPEEVNEGGRFDSNITLPVPKQQTWYLTPENKSDDAPTANDGLEHAKDNLMHKGSGSGTGEYFNLNYTGVAWFYADTGAECGLGFGDNPWKAHIRTEAIEGDEVGHNLTVEICRLEKGTGNVTVLASHTEQLTAVETEHLWNITCEDNESTTQDFSTGDWLAVRLSWDCPTDELQIYYKAEAGNDSYIESPSTDPGYPIPELSTLILFASGLLALVGYVLLERDKRKRKNKNR